MGQRQKVWARAEREHLQLVLGRKCASCYGRESLTFDCIQPANDGHHSLDLARRMSYYRREIRRGNLQLLCHFCNSCKSGLNAEEWRLALNWLLESAAIQRLSSAPGGGTAMTSLERRECLAVVVSRIYATRAKRAEILANKSLV